MKEIRKIALAPITDKMKKIDEATTLLENSGFDVVERIEGCYGEEFLKIEVNEFTWDFVDGELWVSSFHSDSSKFEEIKSFDLDAIAEVILEFHGLVSPTETKSVIEHILADYDKLTFKRKAPMIDIILNIQRLEKDIVPLSYDTLSINYKVAELIELVNKRIAPYLVEEKSTIALSDVASSIIENISTLVDECTFNYLRGRNDRSLEAHIVQTGVDELFEGDNISVEDVYTCFVNMWDGSYKAKTTTSNIVSKLLHPTFQEASKLIGNRIVDNADNGKIEGYRDTVDACIASMTANQRYELYAWSGDVDTRLSLAQIQEQVFNAIKKGQSRLLVEKILDNAITISNHTLKTAKDKGYGVLAEYIAFRGINSLIRRDSLLLNALVEVNDYDLTLLDFITEKTNYISELINSKDLKKIMKQSNLIPVNPRALIAELNMKIDENLKRDGLEDYSTAVIEAISSLDDSQKEELKEMAKANIWGKSTLEVNKIVYDYVTLHHNSKSTIEGFSVTPFKYQTITSEIANKLDIELRAFRNKFNFNLLNMVFTQCNVNSISELTNTQSDEILNYMEGYGNRV